MAWTVPWNLIGVGVSGDIGDFTIYTDRFGRKVVFPKSPPKEPPSENQVRLRERFRLAQERWAALTDAEKTNLEDATNKSSIVMTGQNLYISVALRNTQDHLNTVARQTGITLPAIPYIP